MDNSTLRYTIINAVLLLLLLSLVSGCLEHRFLYQFRPDDRCDLTYIAQGDSADIYTPPLGLPDSLVFQLSTQTETDSTGRTTHKLVAQRRFYSDNLPSTFALKEVPWTEVLLQHPTQYKHWTFFFFDYYSFNQSFNERQRDTLEGDRWKYIPPECRRLEAEQDSTLAPEERAVLEEKYAAGMLLWNTERYKLRFRQIVEQALALHPDLKVPPAWVDSALTEADSLVEAYFNQTLLNLPAGDLDMLNLEWWKGLEGEGYRILTQNLNMWGDTSLQAEIPRVSELLELRHQVSEDLRDESFQVRVSLPGWIFKSNAAAREGTMLEWTFQGEDLQNRNVHLQAASLFFYPMRIAALLILTALVVGIGRHILRKK